MIYAEISSTNLVVQYIKNVIAIAHALAIKKNTRIVYSHVLQAVKASENFFREFNGVGVMESLYNWFYKGRNQSYIHFSLLAFD